MRIATWNVERLKHKNKLDQIIKCCRGIMADILVLTETDSRIELPYPYCFQTFPVKEICPDLYRDTENRVSIYSRYDCIKEHTHGAPRSSNPFGMGKQLRCFTRYETYDKYTARCVELETEQGNLIVYGTIMGVFGNREGSYARDLQKQIEDIGRLSGRGNLCVIGDYNCSFSDNYYYTKNGREALLQCFQENHMTVLTADRAECIDHIAVSTAFLSDTEVTVEEWNMDKALSDHKGIVITSRDKRENRNLGGRQYEM